MKGTLERTVDKTDVELKDDVLAELKYQPGIKVTDLGVLVNEGIVTLNGHTSSYNGRWEVVRAVKRIAAVKAKAVGIEVDDDTPLATEEMLLKRDCPSDRLRQRDRWELDPASADEH
ncbi:MAG: DUF6335 family protein [Cyanobacteria bacterium]|nr:DUF6335 family protein [Cyanobacteriota bacterium]